MCARPSATSRYREAFLYRDRVAELEGLIAKASPALLTVDFGGWQVRRSRGARGHASSVWPRDSLETRPLDERIASVERFYAGAGVPPTFLVGPGAQPRGLEQALARRGYRAGAPIQVRTLSLEAFASRATGALAARAAAQAPPVEGDVVTEVTAAWVATWADAAGVAAAAADVERTLLARVPLPSAYATARVDGTPVAVARGTAYGGWLGVDHLTAAADAPHAGAGRALAGALASWAADHDVAEVHLQVDTGDPAAAALVGDLGGRVAFSSRFWTRELAAVPRRAGR